MKNIITILFFLLSFFTYSQKGELDAVIYWRYINRVEIFDEPNGIVIKTIQNDTINENLIELTISKIHKGFFKVKIGLAMNKETISGWIKSADYIGANHRHEDYPMNLVLYSRPKKSERNIILLKDWKPDFITILNFENDWVYVSVDYNGKRKTGWIQRNQLCANSYSTCS